jgi:1-acyl-sn-glycerol-3-phosphate acyltransferase
MRDNMNRPPPEALAKLRPIERATFELADFWVRRMDLASAVHNSLFMSAMLWAAGGRRIHAHGLENVTPFGKDARLLLVANHRSFFDFFVVMAALFWRTRVPRRILFPVRSTFFYDHPLGPLVNWSMAGMRMFPPVLRDKHRRDFNVYGVERTVSELGRPGTMVGMHPEGTRNKGPDPYALLPAQPGVGKIALAARFASVIPFFVLGMGNRLEREFIWNWTSPEEHRIDVLIGAPIDFSDLDAHKTADVKRAADRCMEHIAALAEEHRRVVRDRVPGTLVWNGVGPVLDI